MSTCVFKISEMRFRYQLMRLRKTAAQSPRLRWPSIMGGDAGDPGGPAALCKLGMEWVCQVGGKD